MDAKELARMNAVKGMTFREYAAVTAMQAVLSAASTDKRFFKVVQQLIKEQQKEPMQIVASMAVEAVDMLIEELAKEKHD